MQEAARSRYNDVLDFDSSSAILKIEWREEDLDFTAHVQPFLSPVFKMVVNRLTDFKVSNLHFIFYRGLKQISSLLCDILPNECIKRAVVQ